MSKCEACGRYFRKKRSAEKNREFMVDKAKEAIKNGTQSIIKAGVHNE